MRARMLLVAMFVSIASARADVRQVAVFSAAPLGQNFMGGLDYLTGGDLVGLYTDPRMILNPYVAVIDADGDGVPQAPEVKYDFGAPGWGAFLKVSPDGKFALFGDSLAYTLYSMDLATFQVAQIVPTSGSFTGMYDLAFIDEAHCYISANPGGFGSLTNKILHLDLGTRKLTEVASIEGTFSGPIDVDDAGNLYYARGKGNFPPQPGDFTVLKFDADRLRVVLFGAPVAGESDAMITADGLAGGQDVAWHSSGTLFVADANNGRIYRVDPNGDASDYAFLPGEAAEGFLFCSLYRRDLPLDTGGSDGARLAASYLPLSGHGQPDTYLIRSPLYAGGAFVLTAAAQPTARAFDAYVVLAGPAGAIFSVTSGGVREGMQAFARNVPGLPQEFEGKLLDMTIPEGAPRGAWTLYAGLVSPGADPEPSNAFALDSLPLSLH